MRFDDGQENEPLPAFNSKEGIREKPWSVTSTIQRQAFVSYPFLLL
jgi:hypothetical protein